MERRRTSTGGPSCTVCTRRAALQAANDGRAAERMPDHVATSRLLCSFLRIKRIYCAVLQRHAASHMHLNHTVIWYAFSVEEFTNNK